MRVRQGALTDAASSERVIRDYLVGADREHAIVLLLDNKNKIIGINTVSVGTLTASLVHPREVYKPAIVSNAANVIFSHNLCAATHKLCYVERRVM
jgi:DNA repair protein RadC